MNYSFNDAIGLSANYTYTKAEDRFALRIPENKVNASIDYAVGENTEVSLNYQFTGQRSDSYYDSEIFENVVVNLESYNLLDFSIRHKINQNVKIFAGVSNITNERYEEIYRFNTRGRNARFGLALNF